MNYSEKDLIKICKNLSDELRELKMRWDSEEDYHICGERWLNQVKSQYNNSEISDYATVILYTELKFYRKIINSSVSNYEKVLIMKGGGIKGLAYVGALEVLEEYYSFDWYAGTSAGAIAAVLLSSGYSIGDLKNTLLDKNFKDFLDANFFQACVNLIGKNGFYRADSFRDWIDELLGKKLNSPVEVRLKDLPNRTTIYASREDHKAYIFDSSNESTNQNSVSFAARCSMSIPYFFIPQTIEGYNVYDGGMQNNFPVGILLEKNPNTDFLGLYLGPKVFKRKNYNFFERKYKSIINIWIESSDPEILREYKDKIVIIDPSPISTKQFQLTDIEKNFLLEAGRLAAIEYLNDIGTIGNKEMIKLDYSARNRKLEKTRVIIKKSKKRKKYIRCLLFFVLILLITTYFIFF